MDNGERDGINEKGSYRKLALGERNKRIDDLLALLDDTDNAKLRGANAARAEAAAMSTAINMNAVKHAYFYLERAIPDRNVHVGHRKRLRESALRGEGLKSFSDVEIVELILSFMIPRKDTNILAHQLIDRFGSVLDVVTAPKGELIKFPCLTRNAAEFIRALPLVGQLKHRHAEIRITHSNNLINHLSSVGVKKGETLIVLLDEKHRLLADERIKSKYIPVGEIVAAVCSLRARYVFVCRILSVRDRPTDEAQIQKLEKVLYTIGAKLIDYVQINPAGYGSRRFDRLTDPSGRIWQYMPSQMLSPSPELILKLWCEDSRVADCD